MGPEYKCINLDPFIGQKTSGESYHWPADLKGMVRRISLVSLTVVVGEKVERFRVATKSLIHFKVKTRASKKPKS